MTSQPEEDRLPSREESSIPWTSDPRWGRELPPVMGGPYGQDPYFPDPYAGHV